MSGLKHSEIEIIGTACCISGLSFAQSTQSEHMVFGLRAGLLAVACMLLSTQLIAGMYWCDVAREFVP